MRMILNWTAENIDLLESWWIQKSRVNFLAYRQYMRNDSFLHGWFIDDLCKHLQQFYVDCINGERPILLIQTPPQHGKSWSVSDFISWMSGKVPELKSIYATFSDHLSVRCNLAQQRQIDSRKYNMIFPGVRLSQKRGEAIRTTKHLEFLDIEGIPTEGQFRNTTVGGSVTGETLDIGVVDDAVKGREQANSITWSQKIWEWFTDDFLTRFSEFAGLLVVMTRWTTHDIIARITKKYKEMGREVKVINYKALATKDEEHRKVGEALFPELKSREFLEGKKSIMIDTSWESLYQGGPTVTGGNIFKDDWWQWYTKLPPLKYKFITADTAQKDKRKNDWTVFQAWGYGIDNKIYLLDKMREKMKSPTLRKEAEMFYNTHNTPKLNVGDPILRGMYIEDKSSGTGLIQELRKNRLRITEVPRSVDKNLRGEDASIFIKAEQVVLSTGIPGVSNLTKEAREFPNSEFDDDIDALMTAVEVAFINKNAQSSLQAAMEAN